MTGRAAVSAPGKTILFGEHAAVYGHAALVTALDHRMRVTVRQAPSEPAGALRLEIPKFRIDRTIAHPRAVERVREPGDLAVLAAAAGLAMLPPQAAGVRVRIDSAIPPGSGFGSSAALAVAVVAACLKAFGHDAEPDDVGRVALAIERHQHGRASGVDVQAVLRGGVLRCRRVDDDRLELESLPAAAAGLSTFRVFHSGTPNESTGDMVAAVSDLLYREAHRVRDAFEELAAATREGLAALVHGGAEALVPVVRRAEAALEVLGVVPEPVRAAIRAIESAGGAAKISGAGGKSGPGAGLVLVAHPDPAWHERFVPPTGWVAHRVRLGVEGLRMEAAV
jgi:mevalonate kinase